MIYFVYIIRTNTNHLYIGHSNNLNRRELEHKYKKEGAKYLKDSGTTFVLAYSETFDIRIKAVKREKQLTRWTRAKKEALIAGNIELLKNL